MERSSHPGGSNEAPPSLALEPGAVRWQVSDRLIEGSESLVADIVAAYPYHARFGAACVPMGEALVRLVATAVRSGHCDPRSGAIVDLIDLLSEFAVGPDHFLAFAHVATTKAVEMLSADPKLGAGAARWPQTANAIRRGVFDVIGAWVLRLVDMPSASSITDTLTTLHTRPVFDTALAKELQRAERFAHWLSMMLVDVDDLSAINRVRGFGVGDQVLESTGMLVRRYFRQHDWIARYNEDSIAVLLPETRPREALALANEMRGMLQERLAFDEYRTTQPTAVTVSVGLVSAEARDGEPIDATRFLEEVGQAVARARSAGGNRVEAVVLSDPTRPT